MTDWSEDEYQEYLESERHLFAWCLVRYGKYTHEAAVSRAESRYPYEPPGDPYRGLVFHAESWHWAMLEIFGGLYWEERPELEQQSAEYLAESARYEAARTPKDLPCPACGFLVLEHSYGSHDICPLCSWEDDAVQLANPCSGGGVNHESLAEAQLLALQKHPLIIQERDGIKRSSRWRPLTPEERSTFDLKRVEEHWSNSAVMSEHHAYWRR